MPVRHCGLLHARGAVPLATIRLHDRAGPPRDGPPPPRSPPPARGPLSDLWRPAARRHASVDLPQGLCRYQLRGAVAWTSVVRHGWQSHGPRAPYPGIRQHKDGEDGAPPPASRAQTLPLGSADAPMAMPHHGCEAHDPPPLVTPYPQQTHSLACGASLHTGLKRPQRVASILISRWRS